MPRPPMITGKILCWKFDRQHRVVGVMSESKTSLYLDAEVVTLEFEFQAEYPDCFLIKSGTGGEYYELPKDQHR